MVLKYDFYQKLMTLALTLIEFLFLVLLKPAKTALMLWLHGKHPIIRAAVFDT